MVGRRGVGSCPIGVELGFGESSQAGRKEKGREIKRETFTK